MELTLLEKQYMDSAKKIGREKGDSLIATVVQKGI